MDQQGEKEMYKEADKNFELNFVSSTLLVSAIYGSQN